MISWMGSGIIIGHRILAPTSWPFGGKGPPVIPPLKKRFPKFGTLRATENHPKMPCSFFFETGNQFKSKVIRKSIIWLPHRRKVSGNFSLWEVWETCISKNLTSTWVARCPVLGRLLWIHFPLPDKKTRKQQKHLEMKPWILENHDFVVAMWFLGNGNLIDSSSLSGPHSHSKCAEIRHLLRTMQQAKNASASVEGQFTMAGCLEFEQNPSSKRCWQLDTRAWAVGHPK